ncbi:hypothetical protein AB5I41_08065 [Sphingomonas sp. MMS24-JH45]
MTGQAEFLTLMENAAHQRLARRRFVRLCGGAAAMSGGLSLLAGCGDDSGDKEPVASPTPNPTTGVSDVDILNFALQLEYLGRSLAALRIGQGLNAPPGGSETRRPRGDGKRRGCGARR